MIKLRSIKPEVGYVQEVHEVVCFLLEDARQEVHIQFDSTPEEHPVIQITTKPTKTK